MSSRAKSQCPNQQTNINKRSFPEYRPWPWPFSIFSVKALSIQSSVFKRVQLKPSWAKKRPFFWPPNSSICLVCRWVRVGGRRCPRSLENGKEHTKAGPLKSTAAQVQEINYCSLSNWARSWFKTAITHSVSHRMADSDMILKVFWLLLGLQIQSWRPGIQQSCLPAWAHLGQLLIAKCSGVWTKE